MKSVPVRFPACLFPATCDSHINLYHYVSLPIFCKTSAKNAKSPLLVDVHYSKQCCLKATVTWFLRIVDVDLS